MIRENFSWTPRRQRFRDEYLVDCNASQAAIRAGFYPRTAGRRGYELMQRPEMQAAIAEKMQAKAEQCDLTAERVLKELMALAFGTMRDVAEWDDTGVNLRVSAELSPEAAAMVSEISQTASESGVNVRVKLHPKVQALEMLGRHLTLFVNRTELTGKDGGAVEIANLSDDEIKRRFAALLAAAGGGGVPAK